MRKCLISVQDTLANSYSDPYLSHTKDAAVRDFRHFCKNPPRGWCPDGHRVVFLGYFDDESGKFDSSEGIQILANAVDLIS